MKTSATFPGRDSIGVLLIGGLATVGLIAGALGPWEEDLVHGKTFSGLDRDGLATLSAGVVAGATLVAVPFSRPNRVLAGAILAGCGAAAVALGIDNLAEIQNKNNLEFIPTVNSTAGWGLWITTLSGFAMTVAAFVLCFQAVRWARSRDVSIPQDRHVQRQAAHLRDYSQPRDADDLPQDLAITMRYLTLSADYHELSVRDDEAGAIDIDELGLPRDLADALIGWNTRYQAVTPKSMADRRAPATAALIDDLDREGLELAERLADTVGTGTKVRYYSEGLLRYLP